MEDDGASIIVLRPQHQRNVHVMTLNPRSVLPLTISSLVQPSLIVGNSIILPPSIWTEFDRYTTLWVPVIVADNRTFCLETNTSGPCSITLGIVVSIGQFNPGCPESILTFSQSAPPVFWQPPSLSVSSGGELSMTSAHSPGEAFSIGTTLVTYTDMQEPIQYDDSRIRCSFNVGVLYRLCAALLVSMFVVR
jgi:hypothetical protein